MTTDEINDVLVHQVFATEGDLENQVTNLVLEFDEHTRCLLMKLYIYYKAYVMDQITHQVTMSSSAYDEYKGQLHYIYENYIDDHQDELDAKHLDIRFEEMSHMLDRFEKTGYKINDCRDLILRNLDDQVRENRKIRSKLSSIMAKTYNTMRVNVTNEQNGGGLSRSACMAIIILAIVCAFIAIYYL